MSDETAPAAMSGAALGGLLATSEALAAPHQHLGDVDGDWDCMASACHSAEALYSNPQSPSQHKNVSYAHTANPAAMTNPLAEESATKVS